MHNIRASFDLLPDLLVIGYTPSAFYVYLFLPGDSTNSSNLVAIVQSTYVFDIGIALFFVLNASS